MRYKRRRGLEMQPGDLLTNEEAAGADALKLLDERSQDVWQQRWTASLVGRATHRFRQTVGPMNVAFDPPTRALFLLTGHGSMNEFLHRRTRFHTTECMCGCAIEDVDHVLQTCPLYHDIRDLERMGIAITDGELDVSRVLDTREQYEELVRFADAAFRRRKELEAME